MKKYNFIITPDGQPSVMPPWGGWGCLWRMLLFLLALGLLILLLSFFRSCGRGSDTYGGLLPPPQNVDVPVDSVINIPDSMAIPGDTDPLPRNDIDDPGPNLPAPDDNRLPPVTDDEIVRDPVTGRQMIDDRVNIILDSDAGDDTFRRWADEFKQCYPGDEYQIVFYDPLTKLIQITVPPGTCDRMVRELPQKITDIPFKAFRDGLMGEVSAYRPEDPAFSNPEYNWYFDPIQAYDAWGITRGSEDVIVAIVDSYMDLRHPELYSDRIVAPFSTARRDHEVAPPPGLSEENPAYFHGSCVSSMALANMNNGNGAAGIAPLCKFMPVSMGHNFTLMSMLYGMLYAMYQGANVINISAGLNLPEDTQQMPIDEQVEVARTMFLDEADVWDYVFSMAEERNVTIVWATGNNNILASIDPSKRDRNTIRVSALDTRLKKASFSNFGNLPEYGQDCSTLSAPGVDILGAVPGNRYTVGPGTSYSAPIVAGAVALMKSLDPTLSNTDIIEILVETGKPIEGCPEIGPMIQIKDALLRVQGNMARADEVINDHDRLTGIWQTTSMLKVSDVETHEWTGEYSYLYFKFPSAQSGTIAYHIPNSSCGTAPVTVRWTDDGCIVKHTATAGSFVPAEYRLRRGSNGLLEVTHIESGNTCNLKRVDSMPCE